MLLCQRRFLRVQNSLCFVKQCQSNKLFNCNLTYQSHAYISYTNQYRMLGSTITNVQQQQQTNSNNKKQSSSSSNNNENNSNENTGFFQSIKRFWKKLEEIGRNTIVYRTLNILFQFWWFRHIARAARLGFLAVVIYQTGYKTGIIDYAQDPTGFDKDMMKALVKSSGADGYYKKESQEYKAVSSVASRVIKSAREYVGYEINQINNKINEIKLTNDNNTDFSPEIEDLEERKQTWIHAENKLDGEWFYIVTTSGVPNAFVSDLLPRRIFVNRGLLEICNPDELALILAHEVGHVILKHTRSRNTFEAYFAGAELVMLAFIDPTGVLAFLSSYCLSKMSKYIVMKHSRTQEQEADQLGIEITARACYNTKKATQIFAKFAMILGDNESWTSSHPPSLEREQYLLKESETHSPERYKHCGETERQMLSMLDKWLWKGNRSASN